MNNRSKVYAFFFVLCMTTACNVTQVVEKPGDVGFWYYDSITFEIAPTTSATTPSVQALAQFRVRLHENMLCKKSNVKFIIHPHAGPVRTGVFWKSSTLKRFETARRTVGDRRPDDRHFYVFVPYIDGLWLSNSSVVKRLGGIQYSSTAFAVFKDGIQDRETGVLLHEFGHLIGLVKNTKRDNHDDRHRYHCANSRCVMYYTSPPGNPDFDYYCKRYIMRRIVERSVSSS